MSSSRLYAGICREKITPPIGSMLYGYYPHPVAEEIADDLNTTVIAFKQGNSGFILISADVCVIDKQFCEEICSEVSKQTGVSEADIIIAATHTHSGPCTASLIGHGTADIHYCHDIFIPRCIYAAKQAVDSLIPVNLKIGTTKSRAGINRRQRLDNRSVGLGQYPEGEYDPILTVLSFADDNGRSIANILHYACHGTSAGILDKVTRDWQGVALDRLENESGAVSMFLNGCEGNVGPRLSNGKTIGIIPGYESQPYHHGSMECVREIGDIAANDAAVAYRNAQSIENNKISIIHEKVMLPYRDGGFKELPQTLISFGNILFIPLSFEAFTEISLALRKMSGFEHTICIGLSNGCDSYLPTKEEIPLGGYETDMFTDSNPRPLRDDCADVLVDEILRISRKFNVFTE